MRRGPRSGFREKAYEFAPLIRLILLVLAIAILVKVCFTHDQVTLIEARVYNATFMPSELCDDHNNCTLDGFDQNGRCVNSNLPQGYPCITPCGSTAMCNKGECVPSVCDGNCETAADCPAFVLYPNTTEEVQIPAFCLASICVYETVSNQTEFSVLPDAQNLLLDHICGKSAMGLTGFRHNTTGSTVDFDQDGIPDELDPFTPFDTLDQPIQVAVAFLFPGPDTRVLAAPTYLSGWTRTLAIEPVVPDCASRWGATEF